MAEYPSLPLWTDAYLADTSHLSTTEHGAYILLLMAAWRRPSNSVPDDDRLLAKIVRQPLANWVRWLRPSLAPFFSIADGEWRQKRLDKERAHVAEVVEKRRKAAQARHRNGPGDPPKTGVSDPQNREVSDLVQSGANPLKPNGPASAHADAHAPAHGVQPTPTPIESKTPYVRENPKHCRSGPEPEAERPPERGADAPLPLDEPAAVPAVRPGRYPALQDLPKHGGDYVYPLAFEGVWVTYPRRSQDTKQGCYRKFRAVMRERGLRPDPEQMLACARRWRDVQGDNPYRVGLLRWLEEGLYRTEPPHPRAEHARSNDNRPIHGGRRQGLRPIVQSLDDDELEKCFGTAPRIIEGKLLS